MMTRDLIENRIQNFWGYGNLSSDIWFIGMEEGFDGSADELEKRFKRTMDRSVIDIQDDMKDVPDHMKWFHGASRIQSTWGKLILILLSMRDEKIGNDQIKEYQRRNFGRLNSDHCVLEFMPLPCPSTHHWDYGKYGVDYLENRAAYERKVMPARIELFRNLINKYSPRTVIFYAKTYMREWEEIIGQEVKPVEGVDDLYSANKLKTSFFVIPHPVARVKKGDWQKIANTIKRLTTA